MSRVRKIETTAEPQEIPILKGEVGGKLGEHCIIMEATRRSEWSTISNGIALKFLSNMCCRSFVMCSYSER